MSVVITPVNPPFDTTDLGDGRIAAAAFISFDATAVGGIAGQTYDPTNHLTTSLREGINPAASPFTWWGMEEVEQIEFSGESSDQQASIAGAQVGRVIGFYEKSINAIILFGAGGTGNDPITLVNATELDNTANALSAVFLFARIIGRGTPRPVNSGRKTS